MARIAAKPGDSELAAARAAFPPRAGLELSGYVPDLYQHLSVCDLAVVQGGLTTTMNSRRPGGRFSTSRSRVTSSRTSTSLTGSTGTGQAAAWTTRPPIPTAWPAPSPTRSVAKPTIGPSTPTVRPARHASSPNCSDAVASGPPVAPLAHRVPAGARMVSERSGLVSNSLSAELRNDIAAAGDLRDRLRAAVSAGSAAAPSASWGAREQQTLDALRAVVVFLHHHANTGVARAITQGLRPT